MRRLQTLFLALLIVCSGFGQTILRQGNTVLRAYDSNQPLNIETSCEVWLDGKDDMSFTLDGTSVDQWDDKSGNDRHVLNTNNDATRPTYNINTGRVTFINANSTFLQSAAFGSALTQPNTIFIVYKITGALSDFEFVFDGGQIAIRHVFYYHASSFKTRTSVILVDGANDANDNIHCIEFNTVNTNYWINGILKINGDVGTYTFDQIVLGARYTLDFNADCEIMEVIVYNTSISAVDRDKITGYLANKWDITATTDFKGYVLTTE